ncbi:phosphotransferase family protein [Alkalihalobacillus sp. LMS39]|uniref:phosphotransferase family protein n=1 Tax=Alkalihalobacillus sp. LMS39 TaxID=2924032 RepID=UPI001FB2D11C|nr:phosphotransferase family protein [Alkalihalobacillus sp. LMS39]UOE93501.1 phosphotransferase family protein [Alkalihalobacillus sp. LMS39]
MNLNLGEGWQVSPAGGATGEAYIAQQGDEKLFLKRNSSPFLAVLSAEGIVPKLLWTKRLENGDVITAQKWVSGNELKAFEMNQSRVAQLLGKIHRSSELLHMFKRIGNEPLTPHFIIEEIKQHLSNYYFEDDVLEEALIFLYRRQEQVKHDEYVVCHCDVNHNNWMMSEDGDLFLIDWDGATVADPALDLGLMLYLYIPEEEWTAWLNHYGIELTESLQMRMHWYVVSQLVLEVIWHGKRGKDEEVTRWKAFVQNLIKNQSAE